jgi:hypothetical protein
MTDETEELGEGREIVRNPDGTFAKTKLSSETAKKMGERAHSQKKKNKSDTLLEQAGFENPSKAPEHLKVLAEMAVSKRSGSVQAMNAFLKLTLQDEPEPIKFSGKIGEKCPTCGTIAMVKLATPESLRIPIINYDRGDE